MAKYPSGVPFVGYPDVPALRVTLGHRPKGRFKANLWDYDHPISFWRRDLKEAGIEEKKALTSNLRLVSSGTSATTFFW